jgi:flagellar export protein FliJ
MFHFSLSSLLRLRALREGQKLAALQRANVELRRSQDELEQLGALKREALTSAAERITCAGEIQFARDVAALLRTLEKGKAENTRTLGIERDRQQAIFSRARIEREILERLREHQQEAYLVEERRRDQRYSDEMHSLIHGNQTGQTVPSCPADSAE